MSSRRDTPRTCCGWATPPRRTPTGATRGAFSTRLASRSRPTSAPTRPRWSSPRGDRGGQPRCRRRLAGGRRARPGRPRRGDLRRRASRGARGRPSPGLRARGRGGRAGCGRRWRPQARGAVGVSRRCRSASCRGRGVWENNETGAIQPIPAVVEAADGIPVHSDAVQAVGHIPVDFAGSGLSTLALSGHKLGAPVGIGALLARRDAALSPVVHGGGQERGVRSGTLDAAGARALATAVRLAVAEAHRAVRAAGGAAGPAPGRRARACPRCPCALGSRGSAAGSSARDDLGHRLGRPAVRAGHGGDRGVLGVGMHRRCHPGLRTCCWRWATTTAPPARRCGSRGAPRRTPMSTPCSPRFQASSNEPAPRTGWVCDEGAGGALGRGGLSGGCSAVKRPGRFAAAGGCCVVAAHPSRRLGSC